MPLSEVVKASQASRGMRIQTAGVATYSDPEWRVLFVQDQAVGMFLWAPPNSKIAAGDKLQIVGNITSQGELEQSSFHIVSRNNPLPAPVSVTESPWAALPLPLPLPSAARSSASPSPRPAPLHQPGTAPRPHQMAA